MPKINRLIDMCGANVSAAKSEMGRTSAYKADVGLFDAFYELENLPSQLENPEEDTAIGSQEESRLYSQEESKMKVRTLKLPQFTQQEFKQNLIDQILDTTKVETEFSKLHLLMDRLFQNEDDMQQQNSYLFHLKFGLVLSSMV